jgi:LsmAD domain
VWQFLGLHAAPSSYQIGLINEIKALPGVNLVLSLAVCCSSSTFLSDMSQPRGAWATQPAVVTAARKESSEKAYLNSCRDRFIAFTKTLMGEHVEVQLRNGTVPQTVEGILHVCSLGDRADGAFDVVLRLPSSQTRHISSSHIVQLTARSYPVGERKRGGEFATDTDISGRPNAGRVRDLEAVDSSWFTGPAVDDGLSGGIGANSTFHHDDSLNGKGGRGGGGRKWDQFEANKRLFNVTSTFDENLYTTPLDRSKVTSSQQRTAERIAYEIESGMSANSHMREERNQQTEQDNDMDEEERYGGVIGTGGLAMHHISAKTGGTAALLAAARAESGGLGSGSRSPQTPTEFTHSNSGSGAYRPPAVRKAEATQHATQQAKHQLQDVLSGKLKSSNTADGAAAVITTPDTTDSNGGATVTASVSDIENVVDKADSTSVATEGTPAAATGTTVDATADSKTAGTGKKAETVDNVADGIKPTTESPVVKKDSDASTITTTPTISTAKVPSPSTATTTTTSAASTPTTAAATIAKKSTLTLNAKAKEFKPSGFKATAKEFVPGGASVSATSTTSTVMSPPPLHTTGTLRRNSISSNSGNISPTPGHHTPTHHQQQHLQHGSHSGGGHQQHHQQHHTSPHHTAMDHTHHQQHLQQSPLHHQHVPGMVVDPNMVSNQHSKSISCLCMNLTCIFVLLSYCVTGYIETNSVFYTNLLL